MTPGFPSLAGGRAINVLLRAYVTISVLFYFIVYINAPLAIEPTAAIDDGAFMTLGRYLAQGQWLGPFDQYTLMKGPGYSVFLALVSWLGISISWGHAALHCVSIVFVAVVCRRFVQSAFLVAVLFTLLLWHPIPLSSSMLRVVRDVIVGAQVLIFIVAFAWALCGATSMRERAVYGLVGGLSLGWFLLTREEGAWVFPAIAVIVAAASFRAWLESGLRALCATLMIIALSASAGPVAFRLGNWWVYGKFVGVDFKEANFQRALGAINSVRSGSTRSFVSVTRETRGLIYAVSPAFEELKPVLDGPVGKGWETLTCRYRSDICGEIWAAVFMWALRDSAAWRGYYASPAKASEFFGRIADEISAACIRGGLVCKPPILNEVPYYDWAQLSRFPRKTMDLGQLLLLGGPLSLDPGPSTGDPKLFGTTLRFLNYPHHTHSKDIPVSVYYTIIGWYHVSGDQWFSASIKEPDGVRSVALSRIASPDVATEFNDPQASLQRFAMRFECGTTCALRLTSRDGQTIEQNLADMGPAPIQFELGPGVFRFERAEHSADPAYAVLRRNALSDSVRGAVLKIYRPIFLPLLAAGLLAFLVTTFKHWQELPLNVSYVLALASWALVISRVALLVWVELVAFSTLSYKYLGPAYPMLVCAVIFSIIAWIQLSGWGQDDEAAEPVVP